MDEKQQFLLLLSKLRNYTMGGIDDYLRDNSIDDYLANDGLSDFEQLAAIDRITAFVEADDYPWWKEF